MYFITVVLFMFTCSDEDGDVGDEMRTRCSDGVLRGVRDPSELSLEWWST